MREISLVLCDACPSFITPYTIYRHGYPEIGYRKANSCADALLGNDFLAVELNIQLLDIQAMKRKSYVHRRQRGFALQFILHTLIIFIYQERCIYIMYMRNACKV